MIRDKKPGIRTSSSLNINSFRKKEDIQKEKKTFYNDNFSTSFRKVTGVFDNNFSEKHDASVTPQEVLNQYSFQQIETALIAFCGDLQLKVQKILPKVPVFVLQTGDETYLFKKKFEKVSNKEILEVTPRLVIKFEDVQIASDQMTMQFNNFIYNYKGINYQCVGRRVPIEFNVSLFFISPNFVIGLQNLEIMLSIFSRDSVFTYKWAGLNFESSYSSVSTSSEYPSLEFSSQSKNMVNNFQMTLQIQLLSPRAETIKRYDENWGANDFDTSFNIHVQQGGETNFEDTLEIDGSETDTQSSESEDLEATKRPNHASLKLPTRNPVEFEDNSRSLIKLNSNKKPVINQSEEYNLPTENPVFYEDDNDKKYDL